MSNYELCIDIGSDYTTIYKRGCGIVLREPSLILLETIGKNMKVAKIGIDAQRVSGKISSSQVFVRPIIEGVIKNVDLTKKMVSSFIDKVVPYNFVKPVIKIIVCLPIGLNSNQYDDYKNVFYSIGFAKIDFVYGCVCASLVDNPYFSLGKANLLVNIGGGKTEISTIVNNKIISACSLNVGGNLIDKSIAEHVQKTKNYVISTNIACKLKQEIGSLYETDKSNLEVLVQDGSTGSPLTTIITAQELRKPIYESYFKILQTIQAFLNQSSPEVAQDIKNEGIIVYGGGSLITGLEKFFKKVLNLSVFVIDNAEILNVIGSEKLFSNLSLLQKIEEEN